MGETVNAKPIMLNEKYVKVMERGSSHEKSNKCLQSMNPKSVISNFMHNLTKIQC